MDFRHKNIDLVGKMWLWFGLSMAVMTIGIISLAAVGMNLGIDFKGGGQLQYRIPIAQRPAAGQDVALLNNVRSQLEKQGLDNLGLQIAGGDTLVVQTDARGDNELSGQERNITGALATQWKIDTKANPDALKPLSRELVGPVIGKELRNNAIKGVVFGVLLIALWIYIRYNFAGDGLRYAVAGIIALLHDVVVLLGIFSLIGYFFPKVEIDGAFIAALLTVVGYSINDSVVIFDRIRENLRQRRKDDFNTVVNDSLLETMSRSINTGLTVIIMLVALLLLGGESIFNFVLAMLVGIVSGLYSSIFNASMVLVAWHNWEEKKRLQNRSAGRALATAGGTRAGATRTGATRTGAARSGAAAPGATRTGAARTGAARPLSTNGAATTGVTLGKAPAQEVADVNEEGTHVVKIVDDSPVPENESGHSEEAPTRAEPPRKARAKRRF